MGTHNDTCTLQVFTKYILGLVKFNRTNFSRVVKVYHYCDLFI